MGRWRVLREPTVPILLLACVVHAVRRNLFDLLLFAGTATVVIVDARRSVARQRAARPLTRRSAAWATLAVVAFAVLAGPLPQSGGAIRILLVAVGLLALALVLIGPASAIDPGRGSSSGAGSAGDRDPGERDPGVERDPGERDPGVERDPGQQLAGANGSVRGWWVWAVLGVLACLWELTSFAIQQGIPAAEIAHPTASDLIGPVLGSWPGRVVFLTLWAAAGVWLLRRVAGVPRSGRPVLDAGLDAAAGGDGANGDRAGTEVADPGIGTAAGCGGPAGGTARRRSRDDAAPPSAHDRREAGR